MTSTGTTAFNPGAGDLVLNAFSRCGLTGSQLTTEHLLRAETEANLANVKFSNDQPNLWKNVLGSQVLTENDGNYVLDASVLSMIIVYLNINDGTNSNDRVLGPLSTTEWDAISDKTQTGPPTSYRFNRLITPEIDLWPIPDGNATYTLKYRYLKQIEDVSIKSGATLDVPWRWLDAFADELTWRLSRHYDKPNAAQNKIDANESWKLARSEDHEEVSALYIMPGLGGYYS